eukprot:Gregarina_sp_Pseudo_9__3148@NODE_333_length_3135_cov_26_604005_g313_i0_p1_GENE_NODE_333_length_3135_cov_26_604005_g313_i0NODE_333_length_3135_cov_26_604005_g313_i0_p1_ORF_typecomplete_len649_score97_82_NODE_333_length_3135_cov_26_604005_g313_i010683014
MAAVTGYIRHIRPFLSQRQWRSLCVALRLPPITAFTNECEKLFALDPSRPATSGNTPRGQGADRDALNFGKHGAYLLDKRHLHVSLPWREPAQLPVDGTQAAQLLDRVFVPANPARLESIYLHLRMPTAGAADVLQAVNRLVRLHAPSLETLCVTCEFVSHATQLSTLARQTSPEDPAVADPDASLGSASAPGHMQRRPRRASLEEADRVVCASPPETPSRTPVFDLRSCFLPALVYLNLSVPVVADDDTQLSKLSNISLKFLGFEELQMWCRGCLNKEVVSEALHGQQSHYYDVLLKQACCTLETVHISGDLSSRRDGRVFTSMNFLPRLRALSLGWTCEEELRRLLDMLRPGRTTVRDLLTAAHSHPAMYTSFRLACRQLNCNDDLTVGAGLADPTTPVQIPPKLPILRRLSFSGPIRMGLSDLHLDLYTLVNKSSGRGVHFQYGLFSANARRVLNFRLDFRMHPFFALYRDLNSRLHHLYIKGIAEEEAGQVTPFGKSQSKKALAEPVTNDWASLLKYYYVNPSTSSRQRHRIAQRADFRQQRFASAFANQCLEEWRSDSPPPEVGPSMTPYDLFRLEMWHLPVVCQRDFTETDEASALWTSFLTREDRHAWGIALTAYKIARMQPGPLSFKQVLPWWQQTSSPS